MTPKLRTVLALLWVAGTLIAAVPDRPAKAAAASKPDAEIEAEIRRRFARSKVKEDNFTVKVRGGVATLEGKTNVPQRKGSATRMAKSAGAKRVENLIQVSEEGRKKAAAKLARRRVTVSRTERQ